MINVKNSRATTSNAQFYAFQDWEIIVCPQDSSLTFFKIVWKSWALVLQTSYGILYNSHFSPISPTWWLLVWWGFCAVAGSRAGLPPSSRLSWSPPSWCFHCLSCSGFSSLWLAACHRCSLLGSCWTRRGERNRFSNLQSFVLQSFSYACTMGMWNFS